MFAIYGGADDMVGHTHQATTRKWDGTHQVPTSVGDTMDVDLDDIIMSMLITHI